MHRAPKSWKELRDDLRTMGATPVRTKGSGAGSGALATPSVFPGRGGAPAGLDACPKFRVGRLVVVEHVGLGRRLLRDSSQDVPGRRARPIASGMWSSN